MINKVGFKISQTHAGAVTWIQRFGSALNLNLHFHVLFIDGVNSPKSDADLRFHRINAPTSKELNALVATISECVARYLERRGRRRQEFASHLKSHECPARGARLGMVDRYCIMKRRVGQLSAFRGMAAR